LSTVMSNSSDSSNLHSLQERVWLALRLGWTLAEVYGRLAENPPPDTASSSARLFLSDLNPTPNERLWAATQRLVYLVNQLFPPKKKEQGENERALVDSEPDSVASVALPGCIGDLLQSLQQRMPGRGKLPRAADLFDDLNQWSRQTWATLDAEKPVLAEAATLGARLADTYWQLSFPRYGQRDDSEQIWQHMLKKERMNAMIRQVRQVEAYLPTHTGPMLRHSLSEWGITGQLGRSPSGKLKIVSPLLYNLRNLRWAQTWRRSRMKVLEKSPLYMSTGEEKALWKQLQNQWVVWEHLISNRPTTYLLLPSDWRHVRWVTLILYALAVIIILTVGTALFALSTGLVSQILDYLLPRLAKPKEFKDQLSLVSTLAVLLGFLAAQIRHSWEWMQNRYDAIRNWVMMRKLQQRSLHIWNGRTKSLFWIWLQRLLRGED
jgi:hypothetical protein